MTFVELIEKVEALHSAAVHAKARDEKREAELVRLCAENEALRAAGFDIIERIEEWETAIRKIIGGREVEHGMDLTQLRTALKSSA